MRTIKFNTEEELFGWGAYIFFGSNSMVRCCGKHGTDRSKKMVEDEEKIVGGLETECPWDAARELYGHSDAGGIARGGNPEGCELGGDSSGPWRDAGDRGQHWDPAAQ